MGSHSSEKKEGKARRKESGPQESDAKIPPLMN
jgi:hypothetical protein